TIPSETISETDLALSHAPAVVLCEKLLERRSTDRPESTTTRSPARRENVVSGVNQVCQPDLPPRMTRTLPEASGSDPPARITRSSNRTCGRDSSNTPGRATSPMIAKAGLWDASRGPLPADSGSLARAAVTANRRPQRRAVAVAGTLVPASQFAL